MNHVRPVSSPVPIPARAASLLQKSVWLSNALQAVVVLQEISDLLGKTDSHGN